MTEPLIQILILATITIFVLSRLYAALGKEEHRPDEASIRTKAPAEETSPEGNVTELHPPEPGPVFTGPAAAGLTAIHAADNSFTTRDFLMGAKGAYEMIVGAFAKGDREALKPLLDDDVYEAWDAAIEKREADGTAAYELLRLKKLEIDDAEVEDDMARITVRYDAELGDGERTRRAKELWIFMRPLSSTDPNWLLDDVEAAN
jgi:predicted lipid-binding transport protein (Tim44 family)